MIPETVINLELINVVFILQLTVRMNWDLDSTISYHNMSLQILNKPDF